MRKKYVLLLLVVASLGSATGCTKSLPPTVENLAMQAVLVQDNDLGAIRNHASETGPLSDAIRDYVEALKNINFTNCPTAFGEAFKRHREAWEAAIPFCEKFPELRGEMHDLFGKLKADAEVKAEIEAIDGRIWETWAEVDAAVYDKKSK